jgi:hypothetical protein
MLSSMASADFDTALARHREWGLTDLDLRDGIFGKWLADVTAEEAEAAAGRIAAAGLTVHCLSTTVFDGDVGVGEEQFTATHLPTLDHVLELAPILRPRMVRLIAAKLPERAAGEDAITALERGYPWVLDLYRDAIDRISAAGFPTTIENEFGTCFLSTPDEFQRFFALLDRPGAVHLTWDVQNQWATGVFPTVAVYEQLRDLIGYYHVKGGRRADGSDRLGFNVALDEAEWPVVDITRRVIEDGVSPVICLNTPAHGARIDGYDYQSVTQRDLAFLRRQFKEVE